MSDLLERVLAATGPDRELDEELAALSVGATLERQRDGRAAYFKGGFWVSALVEPYTSSLDAALALAAAKLPGVGWAIYTNWPIRTTEPDAPGPSGLEGDGKDRHWWSPGPDTVRGVWVRCYDAPYGSAAYNAEAKARTAPLAICAALLVALSPDEARKARERAESYIGRVLAGDAQSQESPREAP